MIINKNISFITTIGIVISVIVFISSCSDPFGIDDYNSSLISKDTSIGPPASEKFAVDSLWHYYYEHYYYAFGGPDSIPIREGWKNTHYSQDVKMDTSGGNSIIWIDMKLLNRNPDIAFGNRGDRIFSFHIKMDSIILDENPFPKNPLDYYLDGPPDSRLWSELIVKNLKNGSEKRFSELNSRIIVNLIKTFDEFYDESLGRNVIKDIIKGVVTAEFTNNDALETFRFDGNFIIFYN